MCDDRPPAWNKIRLLQQLSETYSWVFWVDADALIVDLDRSMVDGLADSKSIWFARHTQERKELESVLNAGVILLRSSPFSVALLEAIWDRTEFVSHNWWENAALLDLLGYSLSAPFDKQRDTLWDIGVGVLDLDWNSVPGYCEALNPALNHHARADQDSFESRLRAMSIDRLGVQTKYPLYF